MCQEQALIHPTCRHFTTCRLYRCYSRGRAAQCRGKVIISQVWAETPLCRFCQAANSPYGDARVWNIPTGHGFGGYGGWGWSPYNYYMDPRIILAPQYSPPASPVEPERGGQRDSPGQPTGPPPPYSTQEAASAAPSSAQPSSPPATPSSGWNRYIVTHPPSPGWEHYHNSPRSSGATTEPSLVAEQPRYWTINIDYPEAGYPWVTIDGSPYPSPEYSPAPYSNSTSTSNEIGTGRGQSSTASGWSQYQIPPPTPPADTPSTAGSPNNGSGWGSLLTAAAASTTSTATPAAAAAAGSGRPRGRGWAQYLA